MHGNKRRDDTEITLAMILQGGMRRVRGGCFCSNHVALNTAQFIMSHWKCHSHDATAAPKWIKAQWTKKKHMI